MRKKEKGLTLAEKIEKLIEKVKKKEVISHIDDAFFAEQNEGGVVFYCRRTDLQREPGRVLDVEDEEEVALKAKAEKDAFEAGRDMDYDEFKNKFEDHIEGRAENNRAKGDDSEEGEDAGGAGAPIASKKGKGDLLD
jgi:hypothetical protein